ncbi:hypothetical protein QF048_004529 [Streptomyces sp. W4I9-2]|nr:hypothetical protein [Streptomyces sp. W4I9-2]
MGGEAKGGASGARSQVNAGVANTDAAGGANGLGPRASGGAAVFFPVIAGAAALYLARQRRTRNR